MADSPNRATARALTTLRGVEPLKLVATVYPRRQLHIVVDNYATHKHQRVQAWLGKHPRVQLHFTPTYASWVNLVEVFFSIIERQALRRGDFASMEELVAAIGRFCDGWNQRCQPFTWTKDADQILTTLKTPTHYQQPPLDARLEAVGASLFLQPEFRLAEMP